MRRYSLPLCILLLAGLLWLPACRATYSKANIGEAIVRICEKEYGVKVIVQTRGKTLTAVLATNDILQSDLSISDRGLDRIEHVMLTVSRVALSSEIHYDFFVIVARDYKAGLQVSFVRYLKDVRRLLTDDISRNDYFQRMLIEIDMLPSGGPVAIGPAPEYFLGDFLSRQIASRARQALDQNVVVARLFQVEDVEGQYVPVGRPGARAPLSGTFRMVAIFHPRAPAFGGVATPALREAFARTFLHTAQTVTRRYEFQAYEGLEVVDGSGQRLAHFDRKEFNQDTVNTLMDLIRSVKDKAAK